MKPTLKPRHSASPILLGILVLGLFSTASAQESFSKTPTTQQAFLHAAGDLKAKRWASARLGFRKVLKDDPENLKAHFYLGEIEYYTHHLPQAEGYFRWVNFHDPDTPVNHYYLGRVAYDQKRYSEALSEMEAADRLDDQISIVHYYLGLIHYRQNDFQGSQRELERALALDPSASKAHYALAYLLYHNLHDPSAAVREAGAALKGDGDGPLRAKARKLMQRIKSGDKG